MQPRKNIAVVALVGLVGVVVTILLCRFMRPLETLGLWPIGIAPLAYSIWFFTRRKQN
jgi:ABC-type multidrug transport system permease subunit